MSLRRAWSLSLALALPIVVTAGCKPEEAPAPAPSATAEAVKAPVATGAPAATATAGAHGHWKGHRGGGVAGMLFRAAHDLELKDAQKATVEKLADQLHEAPVTAGGAPGQPGAEMKAYHAALVAQVRAGKIETAKLDPLQAAVDKGQQARKDKEAEALNGLYAALEPAQRKALVAAVRAKQAEHTEHKGEGPKAADRLAHLTKQLDLDAAQQKKLEPLLAKDAPPVGHEEMKKHMDALLTAFEGDGFDAKKLETGGPAAGKGMAQHAQFLTALLPILKPEQREKLALGMEKQRGGGDHGEPGGEEPPGEEPPAAQ